MTCGILKGGSTSGGSSQDGRKWLGSPPFISHFHGHLEGVPQPLLTMVINHLLTGMILQARGGGGTLGKPKDSVWEDWGTLGNIREY